MLTHQVLHSLVGHVTQHVLTSHRGHSRQGLASRSQPGCPDASGSEGLGSAKARDVGRRVKRTADEHGGKLLSRTGTGQHSLILPALVDVAEGQGQVFLAASVQQFGHFIGRWVLHQLDHLARVSSQRGHVVLVRPVLGAEDVGHDVERRPHGFPVASPRRVDEALLVLLGLLGGQGGASGSALGQFRRLYRADSRHPNTRRCRHSNTHSSIGKSRLGICCADRGGACHPLLGADSCRVPLCCRYSRRLP